MTENVEPKPSRKKTPGDATPFEREQLRFFLSGVDVAATLSEINPSLAWLPVFAEMKLVQSETQLIGWIERNFEDASAVRDVVANLRFFTPEAGSLLEHRLNAQAPSLPPVFAESWALVIRHMQTTERGIVADTWFGIVPHLRRGDYSAAVLERLADAMRPKLKIGKRPSWREVDKQSPERPSDLMSIEYEVQDSLPLDNFLAVWPSDLPEAVDETLLLQLTTALHATLADASDTGVESDKGFSISDIDVPSVAPHPQNAYRSGFQLIVRVMAEIWTRLAAKSLNRAIVMAENWRNQPFRLTRRLALFASANSAMPAEFGADMLIHLPAGELFLTNSSVEAYRLVRERWKDFPAEKQQRILRRFRDGPPRSWFREGAEIDRSIDRSRFDILSDMERRGFDIGSESKELLNEIRARWPNWQPKPADQAGFHVWHESVRREIGDTAHKLENISDSDLVTEAKRIAAEADFLDDDSWQGLCVKDPDRALRGLDAVSQKAEWPLEYWEQLLWSRSVYADAASEFKIAQLLLQWPHDSFDKIAPAASTWLGSHAKTLPDSLLWPLWDRIADVTLIDSLENEDA